MKSAGSGSKTEGRERRAAMTHEEKIRYIADYYGTDRYMQTAEECAELIKALSKLQRAAAEEDRQRIGPAIRAVVEEIADVEVMTEQLKYLMGIQGSRTVEAIKEQKLDGQIKRIEENERRQERNLRR